ncbi:protein-disulfide reductase DsbD domain-containing protein [Billgrantia tianxiuensis]|uniref:protein-disulfide reductase DsbD domain-containing protein n=1 Tax=Billgrantia tianxiuensis TaxID=2497861 RepID=UPI003BEEF525
MTRRHLIRLLCCLLLWLPLAAQAQWFSSANNSQGDFLPVTEAFQPSAWHDGETLYIGFENAEGYYLYRHQLGVESRDEKLQVGEPSIPPGEFKSDEFLGDVYVFYERVVFEAPLQGVAEGPLDITVRFQGCADAGLCYPPNESSSRLPPAPCLPLSPAGAMAAARAMPLPPPRRPRY